MKATWKHHEDNNALDAKERNELPASAYAFPDKRKRASQQRLSRPQRHRPLRPGQRRHRNEREQAFANIKAAAKHYGVEMKEAHWQELGKKPHTANPAHKKSA